VISPSFLKARRAIRRASKLAIKQMRALEQEMRSLPPVEPAPSVESTEAGETIQ
jgi:hypothetical protein